MAKISITVAKNKIYSCKKKIDQFKITVIFYRSEPDPRIWSTFSPHQRHGRVGSDWLLGLTTDRAQRPHIQAHGRGFLVKKRKAQQQSSPLQPRVGPPTYTSTVLRRRSAAPPPRQYGRRAEAAAARRLGCSVDAPAEPLRRRRAGLRRAGGALPVLPPLRLRLRPRPRVRRLHRFLRHSGAHACTPPP